MFTIPSTLWVPHTVALPQTQQERPANNWASPPKTTSKQKVDPYIYFWSWVTTLHLDPSKIFLNSSFSYHIPQQSTNIFSHKLSSTNSSHSCSLQQQQTFTVNIPSKHTRETGKQNEVPNHDFLPFQFNLPFLSIDPLNIPSYLPSTHGSLYPNPLIPTGTPW